MSKVIAGIIVVFLLFWMFTDPSGMARVADSLGGSLWDGTTQFFAAVIDFIGSF